MKIRNALISGAAGALALTLLHEGMRRVTPDAPRVDRLGMQAISKGLHSLDQESPSEKRLFRLALLGDLLSNSLYYSLVGAGGRGIGSWIRGGLLGLLGGIGAVALPSPLGLSTKPTGRTGTTQAMTVAWYLAGGLVAGLVNNLLEQRTNVEQYEDMLDRNLIA